MDQLDNPVFQDHPDQLEVKEKKETEVQKVMEVTQDPQVLVEIKEQK